MEQIGNVSGTGKGRAGVRGRSEWKTRTLREKGCERVGDRMWGRRDLIGGVSSLSSHSAHISLFHLLPRLPFLTFFPSHFPLPSFSISSPCPPQLGPLPPGSRAVVQGPWEGGSDYAGVLSSC